LNRIMAAVNKEPIGIAVSSILIGFESPPEIRERLGQCNYYPFDESNPAPNLPEPNTRYETHLHTVELDTLEAATLISKYVPGERPFAVNMANEWNCGGGFATGWGSQEEDLFRRSTLGYSLWPYRRVDDDRLESQLAQIPRAETPHYPFTVFGGVYSPYVSVVKTPKYLEIPLEERKEIAIGSVAAQDLRLHKPGKYKKFSVEITTQKFRTLLWMAAEHNHSFLVLGALGCGAFLNDPAKIAKIFHTLLHEEFQGIFKMVIFAIIKSKDNLHHFGKFFPEISYLDLTTLLVSVPPTS